MKKTENLWNRNKLFRILNAIEAGKPPEFPRIYPVNQKSAASYLDALEVGDKICTAEGLEGCIENIEVIKYRHESHYYFRLEKGKGTILLIK